MRRCDECDKPLVVQRSGARFCGSDCKAAWHNKQRREPDAPAKRITPARTLPRGSRRASRDGRGERVYLLPMELAYLAGLLGRPDMPQRHIARAIKAKAHKAMDRARERTIG